MSWLCFSVFSLLLGTNSLVFVVVLVLVQVFPTTPPTHMNVPWPLPANPYAASSPEFTTMETSQTTMLDCSPTRCNTSSLHT